MTLLQLRYIIAIDRYRHFGKAAEACGLTQSTLSLMVKKLEEELDVRLFDRDAHPVSPTEIGRKVIDQAKVVLYHVEQVAQLTHSEKESLSGPLRIALISTVSPVLIPGLFKYLGEQYPAISLHTEEMLTETILDRLRKAEVDMGILAGPVREPSLLEIPLYHERFLAYVSPDNPAYAQESLRRETLAGQPLWIIRDGLRLLDTKDLNRDRRARRRRLRRGRFRSERARSCGTSLPQPPRPPQAAYAFSRRRKPRSAARRGRRSRPRRPVRGGNPFRCPSGRLRRRCPRRRRRPRRA